MRMRNNALIQMVDHRFCVLHLQRKQCLQVFIPKSFFQLFYTSGKFKEKFDIKRILHLYPITLYNGKKWFYVYLNFLKNQNPTS